MSVLSTDKINVALTGMSLIKKTQRSEKFFRRNMNEETWRWSVDEVLKSLDVESNTGLSQSEAGNRIKKYGKNLLREIRSKKAWQIFLDQFKSLIILFLGVAAVLSFLFRDWMEGVAVLSVIFINTAIGFVTELRAVRSMEALRRMGSVKTRVRRGGHAVEVSAETLVPGDIVILEGGDVVTADMRLIDASNLQVDESMLTGESLPVRKNTAELKRDTPLAERANMLFKGTFVTRGAGEGLVVATGMDTELGRISALVEEARDEVTPLEKRLDNLGQKLIWVTLALTVAIGLIGLLKKREIFVTLETSIALAVAAIPEGLPIVATIALATGMYRMAKRNALINRLPAVETLGATTVIFTDKTGTITENRMTVDRLLVGAGEFGVRGGNGFVLGGKNINPEDYPEVRAALRVAVLCNNASFEGNDVNGEPMGSGDPLEIALLAAGARAGIEREKIIENLKEVREEAFDSESRMMATFHQDADGYTVAVKGAPEQVMEASTSVLVDGKSRPLDEDGRRNWAVKVERLADNGLRVLALAQKRESNKDAAPYDGLTLIGFVGLLDPLKADIYDTVKRTLKAGISIVMLTGDQAHTAKNIAVAAGIVSEDNSGVIEGKNLRDVEKLSAGEKRQMADTSIFARVSPKQKLDLITLYQTAGEVVAMTGDGVNDAPALKKADIGIAMGRRGTQVAREAADMVLKDDAFGSILAAIAQGRVIFDNIRKFVVYLISCNVSEIASVAMVSVTNAPLPLLPLQILFLNLVTDVFPALALGLGEGSSDVMNHGPRPPKEGIITPRHWTAIGGYGLLITAAVIGSLAIAIKILGLVGKEAVSISFLTLALAQLWHVFNMGYRGTGFLRNDVTRNPFIWIALGVCLLLILSAVYIPVLADVLSVSVPSKEGWMVVITMSLFPLAAGRIFKRAIRI